MNQKFVHRQREEAIKEMSKDKTRRLNIILPEKDYKKFSMKVIELNTNMSDWVRSKINELIYPNT